MALAPHFLLVVAILIAWWLLRTHGDLHNLAPWGVRSGVASSTPRGSIAVRREHRLHQLTKILLRDTVLLTPSGFHIVPAYLLLYLP